MARKFYASTQDTASTMVEWPMRIWSMNEFPEVYKPYAEEWMTKDFSAYHFVFVPKRKYKDNSYEHVFGYGEDMILHLKKSGTGMQITTIQRQDIVCINTKLELLSAEIEIVYNENGIRKTLMFPYVSSTYYIYNPFLNWLLGIDRKFEPSVQEKESPRPKKLFNDSLLMYNYSLDAYRLGNGFKEYKYLFGKVRRFWAPWKLFKKEWLEISMERGIFKLYSFRQLIECTYLLNK